MSSQAWRFPADLGNVVPAGFEEVQSEASWLCVLPGYAMGVEIRKRKGKVTDRETCLPARLVRQTAGNNSPGPPLPFVDSPAA